MEDDGFRDSILSRSELKVFPNTFRRVFFLLLLLIFNEMRLHISRRIVAKLLFLAVESEWNKILFFKSDVVVLRQQRSFNLGQGLVSVIKAGQ